MAADYVNLAQIAGILLAGRAEFDPADAVETADTLIELTYGVVEEKGDYSTRALDRSAQKDSAKSKS
jgi:hypothetical protein